MNGKRLAVLIDDFTERELAHLDFQRYLLLKGKHAGDTAPRGATLPTFRRADPGDETTFDPASAGSA